MKTENPQPYIEGARGRNRRMLAKTITMVESSLPAHQKLARSIVDQLIPYSGEAVRVGISGVPGVGKSTFIENLGMMLVQKGHRVAVLAVDPSSARSGGSVMADKTRMERLAVQENAFIRPSPTAGTLGGVARKTRETMLVCEAAGFDIVLVETVGVGQSEAAVASMVDFFLVLMLAGAGDELQGIKKGILELADAVVITKADGDNIEKALKAKKVYETVMHLLTPSYPFWSPPVLTCSAVEMTGIDEVWNAVLRQRKKLMEAGALKHKRRKQALDWMWALVEEGLHERFYKNTEVEKHLPKIVSSVEKGSTSPTMAANELFLLFDK